MTLLILFGGLGSVPAAGSISGAVPYAPGRKRWWEELQEEYQEQWDRERPPSKAKDAVKARKATKKAAQEAVNEGLLTPFNAEPFAQLLVNVQNATKMAETLALAKQFMAEMERLREEDEEDSLLLLS